MTTTNIILTIAATTTALIAGLLYAYSCSVNIGLGRLADAEYISAMQSINKAIQNPLFFISFMGTLLLLPLCTYLNYGQPLSNRFWLFALRSGMRCIRLPHQTQWSTSDRARYFSIPQQNWVAGSR